MKNVIIDNIEYAPVVKQVEKYHIIRSRDAGVFAGEISMIDGSTVTMKSCRRLWYWAGAASLSQMAQEGVKEPEKCKFSVHTRNHIVLGVCEVIPCTEQAMKIIEGVSKWKN